MCRKFYWSIMILVLAGLVIFPGSFATSKGGNQGNEPALTQNPKVLIPAVQKGNVVENVMVPDQYIVVFKDSEPISSVEAVKNEVVKNQGGKIIYSYSAAIKGFAAHLPAKALEALKHNPKIASIEQDQSIHLDTTQSNATWGIDRIDQRNLPISTTYVYNYTGAGVNVYVIDTGIRTTHTQFGGRASGAYTAINDGNGTNDCNGHGTHVAGTIGGSTYGVAKSVHLYAVRVLDCSGSGTNSGVIAGIDWVTSHKVSPAVANMSLGGSVSSSLDSAVSNSINSGVTYAIAAGNSNADACNSSPARVAAAITVGATTSSDARASYSNYGSCLDIFAPGSSITSAWYSSDTATNTLNGTSMATPHVAGVAALYLQTNPGASPATVASAIINAATTGKVTNPGANSPNRLLYSLFGSTPVPSPTPAPTSTPVPVGAPCTNCTHYSGTLSGSGDYDYQPNGNYYYDGNSGYHNGWLRGPSGVDFDLYLWKWNGSSWATVAQSTGSSASENISYYGSAGYYVWYIVSYSGSGSYDFWMQKP
ncbi:MAG: S8 family peptidase [Omnitrophica WOR_2 bacterium]